MLALIFVRGCFFFFFPVVWEFVWISLGSIGGGLQSRISPN